MACEKEALLSALRKIAPEHLAEAWDNVGLLIDPGEKTSFERVFVTIDLTERTLDEALQVGADFIIAYHPPLFSGLKRLRFDAASEKLAVRVLREGITVYSPHTALDAAPGAMGDWLASCLGPATVRAVVPHESDAQAGSGRIGELPLSLPLLKVVQKVKQHLGLSHVRLSRAQKGDEVKTFAVCPGAGGSLFEKVGPVDLLITGEMRHHDVLARGAQGTHVILTDHTNTERGFLPQLAARLTEELAGLSVVVSKEDRDPLQVI